MCVCACMHFGLRKNNLFGEKLVLIIKELKTSKPFIINLDGLYVVCVFGLEQGYPVAQLSMNTGALNLPK